MDSDLRQYSHDRQQQQQQQQQPMNTSRLMRYRSAPSSYFAALMESGGGGGGEENCDEFLNPRPPSPETERILARFISGGTENSSSHSLCDVRQSASETLQPQFGTTMKHETDLFHHQEEGHQQQHQNIGFSSASQMPFQNQSLPSLPNPNSGMDSSYGVMGSTPMEHLIRGGGNSNLIRHSSSPAGLFSHINIENGYGVMRGMGSFGGTNAEESFPSPSRLKGPMDFSSGPPSSSGRTNLISENRSKSMEMGGPEDGSFAESQRNDHGYMAGFPIGSWDDSTILSDSFLNDDRKTFSGMSASENQNAEGGNRPTTMLSHHLSLPKNSAELSAILQFQDSVPCKIRAKRGCATHPRSIAERVRRTRISERMRKLQELVPNMDKQTNTADMLDLAADYIKDLQKQVKTLADQRAKCTCSDNQRS